MQLTGSWPMWMIAWPWGPRPPPRSPNLLPLLPWTEPLHPLMCPPCFTPDGVYHLPQRLTLTRPLQTTCASTIDDFMLPSIAAAPVLLGRKCPSALLPVSTVGADNLVSNADLLTITDNASRLHYLVDTGSQVSFIHATPQTDQPQPLLPAGLHYKQPAVPASLSTYHDVSPDPSQVRNSAPMCSALMSSAPSSEQISYGNTAFMCTSAITAC